MAEYIPGLTIRVMTDEELSERLAELEAVIESGLEAFVETGHALMEIRDSGLFHKTHETFQDYARERWNLSRPEAYRAIDAARVVDVLSPIGDAPANEAQARALAPLLRKGDGELEAAWAQAREEHGDRLTAAKLQSVTNRRLTQAAIREAQQPEPEPKRAQHGDRQWEAQLRQRLIETFTKAFHPFVDLARGDRAIHQIERLTPTQARKASGASADQPRVRRQGH